MPVGFEVDASASRTVLSRCKYFESVVYEVNGHEKIMLGDDRFYSVVCIKGSGSLQIANPTIDITAGESVFVPAQKDSLLVLGELSIVVSHI